MNFQLLDGALATQFTFTLDTNLWSAILLVDSEGKEMLEQVHVQYLSDGVDIITTGSYQASIQRFIEHGLDEEHAVIAMKESVRVVNRAKDITGRKFVKVAASVGPYAVLLADGSEYSGVYGGVGEEQIERFHREKIRILLEEKPDFLALETIPNLMEARILVKVLEEFPNAKAWICACCIDEARLSSGEEFKEFVQIASQSNQIFAIGINCTDPTYISSLLKIAKENTSKSLICYPNGGYKWIPETKSWGSDSFSDEEWKKMIREWLHIGAEIIGGCCKTGSHHIKLIKQVHEEFDEEQRL